MARDLRTFLERLKKDYPGGILSVGAGKAPLDPNECECTALLYKLSKLDKWPTVVFEKVLTPSGEPWPGRAIFNELSAWPNVAAMLDLDPGTATVASISRALTEKGKNRVARTLLPREQAPVKEMVLKGKEGDLFHLPSYRKDSGDARVGWLSGIAVARDPSTGRYNCSWHRLLVHGPDKAAARVNPRHLREIMDRYRQGGYTEMPVAFVFGHHPAFLLAAGVQVGWDVDEYEFAGGLMGESLRTVPSETLGEDFLVPADAEVVVEGFLHLDEVDACGPWSDFILYYTPQTLEPVFRPTAVTTRRDPIFSENWTGYDLISTVLSLATMHLALSERFPRVKAINFIAPYTFAIQFTPKFPGEVNRMATFALGAFGDQLKNIIVVDEDIDPFDLSMVFFSIATRVDPATDRVQVIKDLKANGNDPSSERDFLVGGLIIDSTKPIGRPFPEMGSPPGDVLERMKLADYLSPDDIGRIPSGKAGAGRHDGREGG